MLIFTFIMSFLGELLQGFILPGVSLFVFTPLIALISAKKPLLTSLWSLAFSGVVVDLLSDHPFGIHALSFVLTALCVYRFRRLFLADSLLQLPLFTALTSAFHGPILLFLLFLFDRRVPFAGKWLFWDLTLMPLFDALFAFLWIVGPWAFIQKIYRYGEIYWLRRKKPFPT